MTSKTKTPVWRQGSTTRPLSRSNHLIIAPKSTGYQKHYVTSLTLQQGATQ